MGVGGSVGVRVGVEGIGVGVAFLLGGNPGKEQAVHNRLRARRLLQSQKRIRFFMPGTITEEEGGVK
jgi:hypothetical protein